MNLSMCCLGFEPEDASGCMDRTEQITMGTDACDDRASRIACNDHESRRGGLGTPGILELLCHVCLSLLLRADCRLLLAPFSIGAGAAGFLPPKL